MLLNLHILYDYLPISMSSHILTDRLDYTLLYLAIYVGGKMQNNLVYIMHPAEIPEVLPLNATLILTAPPEDPAILREINYIYADSMISSAQLFNDTLTCFMHFNRWELNLTAALNQKDPLQQLCLCSADFIPNPFGIVTASFYTVCSIVGKNGSVSYFSDNKEKAYMSEDYVHLLLFDKQFIQTWHTTKPSLYCSDPSFPCLYKNIRVSGKNVLRVVINAYDNPIRDSDYPILDFFSTFVQKVADQHPIEYANTHPPYLDKTVKELAINGITDTCYLDHSLQALGWSMNDSYVCCSLLPTQDSTISSTNNACIRLEMQIVDSLAIELHSDRILLIVRIDPDDDFQERFHSIECILRDSLMHSGFSFDFCNFRNLHMYYRQAEIALSFGRTLNPTFWNYWFKDYVLRYILKYGTTSDPIEVFCHPGLLRLMEYDKQKNRQFTETLRIYLENNMSVTQTIKKVYLQRGSFQYQIQRIQEITNTDLHNYDTRLHLLLSFQLLSLQ